MPIYEYRCREGHVTDEYRTVDTRHDCPACGKCGEVTEKIISAVGHAMPDIAGYQSMQDGSWIGSRSTHRDHLKQHGLIEIGNERPKPRERIQMDSPREDIRRAMEMTR